MSDSPTVGIVVRIYIGELPYIKGFLDYYLSIGVKHFYLLIHKSQPIERIRNYLQTYSCFTIIPYSCGITDSLHHIHQSVNEEYLLNIDADEFLNIYPHTKIQEFIRSKHVPCFVFRWMINVNDGILPIDTGVLGFGTKMMCKTSLIQKMIDHEIHTKHPVERTNCGQILLHYWARSFNDILIKSIYGSAFHDSKSSNLNGVKGSIKNGKLPNRFKMMALLSCCTKKKTIPNHIHSVIDTDLESKLISGLSKSEYDRLYSIYQAYRTKINKPNLINMYESGKVRIISLSKYLP